MSHFDRFSNTMRLAALGLTFAAALPTPAQTLQTQSISATPADLPAVVVTASRLPQTLLDTVANTTLLTRSDIERSGASDLPSLLSDYAGIQLGRNGSVGQAANLFLRGASPRSTLVLIDGVPINDQNDGTARLELLPIDLIDRIEIVRGNVSAEYGSNAVGGVIQLFTRSANATGGAVSVELGSQSQAKLTVNAHLRAQATTVLATFSKSKTAGVSAENPAQNPAANPDKDGSKQQSALLHMTHAVRPNLSVGLKALSTTQRSQYDDDYNGTPTSDDAIRQRMTQLSAFADWQITQTWQSQWKISHQTQASRSTANGKPVNSSDNQRNFFSWQNNVDVQALGTVMLGVEHEKTHFLGESFGDYGYATPKHSRSVNTLLAGWQGKAQAISWNINARRDSAAGQVVNTHGVGGAYAINPAWSVRVATANAFTRPTLGQTYDPNYGNTGLSAERSRNQELGMQWAQNKHLVKLTYHRSDTKNMIGFDPLTYQAINLGHVRNRGLELLSEFAMPWSGGKLRLNANRQNPVNVATGALLQRRAKSQASLGLQGQLGAWQWGLNASHMGARDDVDYNVWPASAVTLKAYLKTDASLSYLPNNTWSIGLYLSNLTRANDQSAYGYSGTPRGAVLRLNYKL